MANTVVTNKLIMIDTAGATKLSAMSGAPPAPYKIKEVYWYNPAAVGDTFVVADGNGNTIWPGRCEVASQSQLFPAYLEVYGDLTFPTLGSGVLYIRLG